MRLQTIAGMIFLLGFLRAPATAQSESRLLDLNVVVLDSHGQPVTDLTAGDFQVSDAGKSQKISFFRRNGDSIAQNEPAASPPPGQFSNRSKGGSPNATVVLLDLLNLGYSDRAIAANQIVRDFTDVESADSLYLYLLSVNGRYFQIHGISPGDETAPTPSAAPWTRQIKSLMDTGVRSVLSVRSPDIDVFVRTQLTFAALVQLGEQLSAVPGRKIIIWVTDGVPVALGERRSDTGFPIDFTPQIRQLSQVLERSNIALYPVSQVMLGGSDDIGANSGGAGATGGAGTEVQSFATLNLFADLTGGRRSTAKDIGAAVQEARNDLRFYYQIGYEVPPGNWDEKFHKLRVTSKRKGLHIQAKTGYYAWKGAAGTRTQSAFAATAAAPFDAEEIGLRATVSPDPQNNDAALVHLRVDARDIAFAQDGDRYTGQLRIMSIGYLPTGLIVTGPVIPLDLDYSAAERDQALRDGIDASATLAARQGEIRFRVIVFDRGSNAVGSITIPASTFQHVQR